MVGNYSPFLCEMPPCFLKESAIKKDTVIYFKGVLGSFVFTLTTFVNHIHKEANSCVDATFFHLVLPYLLIDLGGDGGVCSFIVML